MRSLKISNSVLSLNNQGAHVKINLNEAHQEDLVKIPFIDYELAYVIIEQPVLKDGFKTLDELTKLKDFPTDKLDIIKLYLSVN